MMHGRGKSDPGIVAVKPANNAEQSAAELVEPRTGTKGNADQQSTRRAQYRESVSQALGRIRQVSPSSNRGRSRMHKGARPDLCGGRGATRVPTATVLTLGGPCRERLQRQVSSLVPPRRTKGIGHR